MMKSKCLFIFKFLFSFMLMGSISGYADVWRPVELINPSFEDTPADAPIQEPWVWEGWNESSYGWIKSGSDLPDGDQMVHIRSSHDGEDWSPALYQDVMRNEDNPWTVRTDEEYELSVYINWPQSANAVIMSLILTDPEGVENNHVLADQRIVGSWHAEWSKRTLSSDPVQEDFNNWNLRVQFHNELTNGERNNLDMVELRYIPEPSSAIILGLIALGFLGTRRCRWN